MGKKWEKINEFCKKNAGWIIAVGAGAIVSGKIGNRHCANVRAKNQYAVVADALKRTGETTVRIYNPKESGIGKPVAVIFKVIDDSMKES